MDIKEEIIRITSEYFNDDINYFELSEASKAYKDILSGLCENKMDTNEGRNDIEFDNGKALGTYWAALCLDDLIRTRQFIRGINKAIEEKLNSQKQLHILYAGTGPYATLMLPLILRYSKQDIKYTFLEINPLSFEILQNVISQLGLEEHDITFIQEDASKHQIEPNDQPDIIISETMQNALAKEQQVPIFLNLMNQAKNDTVFIPEEINIFIGLRKKGISIEELSKEHYHRERKVLEISKEAMFPLNQTPEEVSFDKLQTVINNEGFKDFDQLLLITEIQVYQDEKISINESGLTTPILIENIPNNFEGSITVDTQYEISSEPKLNYKVTLSEMA